MPAPLRSQNLLCLTGFMGSGKTTVGQELARQLGCAFLDLDQEIERRQGQSVAQIFAEGGEEGFRQAERDAAAEALASSPAACVLATGGGAFPQPEIAALLRSHDATVIFLNAPPEELHRRCVDSLDAGVRPLLKDLSSFRKLYAERLAGYRQAHWQVETSDRTVTEIAAEIAGRVRAAECVRPRERE